MASYRKWTELAFCLIFIIVALCPISQVSSVSYPLNHKGLLPAGRKLKSPMSANTSGGSSSKQKQRKKVLSVSKHWFKKLAENQEEMEKEAETEQAGNVTSTVKVNEQEQQRHVANPNEYFSTPRKFPLSVLKYNSTQQETKMNKDSKFKPYYDCPLFNNENSVGQAIIKPDPFDCGCCYVCNWGIHYVQCCTWPLLWNDDIKSCDWYWKVFCYTSDYNK